MPTQTCELTAEQELHWLALVLVPGLGCRKANALVDHFGSVRGCR
jgi:hypothetical protein